MPHIILIDSGVGGLSVAAEIATLLPLASFSYVADTAFFPYGTKSESAVVDRVRQVAMAAFRMSPCDLIVLACNTASTLALDQVRAVLPIPVVGVVPAIKPAVARSKAGVIGLLGTERTMMARYTDNLIVQFAPNADIIRVGSRNLVGLAEQFLAGHSPDPKLVKAELQPFLHGPSTPDVVVLACTHFPLLRQYLASALPPTITLVDSGRAIALRVQSLLAPSSDQRRRAPNKVFFTEQNSRTKTQRPAFARYGFVEEAVLQV